MDCPECKRPMIRRKSKFGNNFWYGCTGYPQCRVTYAEHPNGEDMSTPAGPEVKALRMKAHKIAEEIWGKWDSKFCKKREQYNWLERNSKSGHIGKMEKDELISTIAKLEETLKWKDVK